MSCFRFLNQNYISLDILANDDTSSAQSAFPISNAYNRNRRSKVWRSDGFYEVTATNSDIVLRETIGVDLTASLTVGEYTRTAFLAEIKTALELVGASTYTVTFTTDFRIRIASNLGGGGGIFQLMLSDPLFTAADLLGFDDVDRTGLGTYTADTIKIHTSEWILWDMGVDSNPTTFVLIDARNSPIKLSPTATIKLQGNHTNVWNTPAYELTLTYDDEVIYAISDDGLHTSGLRYWRVLFIDQNPLGYVQIGSFFLGRHYTPTQGAPQFPFVNNPIDRSETVRSENGQTYSETRQKTDSFTTQWLGFRKTDKEAVQNIFEQYQTSIPFFIIYDNNETFTTSVNRAIKYVKFADEPSFQLVSPNVFSASMRFEEQL